VRKTAKESQELASVAAGARETAHAWYRFWEGIYREVFREPDPTEGATIVEPDGPVD
jgi:hypothetical protein